MDQTTKHIIHSLAKRQPRDLIISDLSERFRLQRSDAEGLVNEIEKKHQYDIVKRRRPFLVLLWGALALGGFTLTAGMLYSFWAGLIILRLPIPYLGNIFLLLLGLLAVWGGTREVLPMLGRRDKYE